MKLCYLKESANKQKWNSEEIKISLNTENIYVTCKISFFLIEFLLKRRNLQYDTLFSKNVAVFYYFLRERIHFYIYV